jgi:hypothetical protein
MAQVRNISNGQRGAYRGGVLVMVDPGKTAEADDWNEEWFAPAGETADESDLASLDLNGLAAVMVTEGMIPSVEEIADDLRRAIIRKREDDAEAGDDDDDDTPATAEDIVSAIGLLDPNNEDHWTKAGLPEVAAVRELAGKPVTRAAIEAAAPDAKRPEPA